LAATLARKPCGARGAITPERFETIARLRPQIAKDLCRAEHAQLSRGDRLNIGRQLAALDQAGLA
jgi:hypothetical protein